MFFFGLAGTAFPHPLFFNDAASNSCGNRDSRWQQDVNLPANNREHEEDNPMKKLLALRQRS